MMEELGLELRLTCRLAGRWRDQIEVKSAHGCRCGVVRICGWIALDRMVDVIDICHTSAHGWLATMWKRSGGTCRLTSAGEGC